MHYTAAIIHELNEQSFERGIIIIQKVLILPSCGRRRQALCDIDNSLLETAERGSKGIEIAVLRHGKELEMLDADAVEKICEEVAKEDAEDKNNEA